jgi:hypothetical protein
MQLGNYVQRPIEDQPLINPSSNSHQNNNSTTNASFTKSNRRSCSGSVFVMLTELFVIGSIASVVQKIYMMEHEEGSGTRVSITNDISASTAVGSTTSAVKKNEKLLYSNTTRFYTDQLIDHFDMSNTATWSKRYYAKRKHFGGPGHPIFLVIGKAGANDVGMLYPFIEKVYLWYLSTNPRSECNRT